MYRLSPEQADVVARSREIARTQIAPHAARVDETCCFPRESVEALGQAGLLGLTIPSSYGGMGQGLRVVCAVVEEISRQCSSTAMIYMMHLCGVACYLAALKKPEGPLQKAAAGKHLSTLAFSEKGSRSHFWAPVSQASRVGANGKIRLSAEKSWVTSAGYADGYVVSTQWEKATSPLQSTIYLIFREDPGISVSGSWQALGMRGNQSAPMRLEGLVIEEKERALCEPGKGFDMMLAATLPPFQSCQAAIALGICEAAIAATHSHLTSSVFEHLRSRLCDLPNLRAQLAKMRLFTDRVRAHLVSTLDALETSSANTQELLMEIKASATETAIEVTDLAMRACGGAAFSKHLGIERHFRDARAGAVMSPTTDQLYDFVGRGMCGMDLF
jgi:alkylation response protein AidB-like acyl-CoA dehydrogenase